LKKVRENEEESKEDSEYESNYKKIAAGIVCEELPESIIPEFVQTALE
jgi:hypothetical protein